MINKIVLGIKIAVGVAALCVVLFLGYLFVLPVFLPDRSEYGDSELAPKVNRPFVESEDAPEGFVLAYEDSVSGAKLFINKRTTEVALMDKDGNFLFSNPQDRDEDNFAQKMEKGRLASQLKIIYYTRKSELKQMDNFNNCLNNYDPNSSEEAPFTIEPIDKGVRITYSIGEKKYVREMLPQIVSKEKFEELILNKLEGADANDIKNRFKLIEKGQATDEDKNLYPYDAVRKNNEDVYVLRSNVRPSFVVEKIYKIIFGKTDYTVEEMEKDNEHFGVEGEIVAAELFVIPLEYTLDNGNLVATIPCKAVEVPPTFHLTQIHLLEFLGAGSIKEDGYIFVPDGSGAIINFNNKKTSPYTPAMAIKLYGRDRTKRLMEITDNPEQAVFPVFGIKRNDSAVFAIIEDGDAHAIINADVSERASSYNKAYASFEIKPFDEMVVSTDAEKFITNKYQNKPYQGYIKVRYSLLTGDEADYSGMANFYRDYLIDKGILKKEKIESIPFTVEYLAAAKDKKYFLGVPFVSLRSLTTTEQALEITKQLYDGGVDNINVKYSGWFAGGYENKLPNRASPLGKIGGKGGFKELAEELEKIGVKLYPDAAVVQVYEGLPFFNPYEMATRNGYNIISKQYKYDPVGRFADNTQRTSFVMNAKYLEKAVAGYVDRMQKLGVDNVWFRDLGSILNSDFHGKNNLDRQVAIEYTVKAIEAAKEKGMTVGFDTANIYAVKYADNIINLPLSSSSYALSDESVPFVEMVLSGCKNYSGPAANLSGKTDHEMLKAVETGGGLYFRWIYADNIVLKKMYYKYRADLYSLYYGDWIEDAIAFYNRMEEEFLSIRQGSIKKHEKLADNVYKTTWESGYVVVNYNDYDYVVDGVVIAKANDFAVYKTGVSEVNGEGVAQ